jgi:putative membrane protein
MKRMLIGLATLTALSACGNPTTNDANVVGSGNDMAGTMAGGAMSGNNAMSSVAMANAMTPPTVDAPSDAPTYLAKAGAGDLFEVESSKAVQAKSANSDVKMFARMMVDAHTRSTQKLKDAAKADGVAVSPPALDPLQQQMLDEIKAAAPDKVDAIYKAHQSKAHGAALALHQGYAAQGDKPALKKAAGEIVPVVRKHISELGKLPG